MNDTLYTVYWLYQGRPKHFQTTDMVEAMQTMETLRKSGDTSAIVMSAEHAGQVGKMGVDAVKNGTLPDGQEYVYKTGRGQGV